MINFGTWFSGNLNSLKMKAGTDDFFVIPNVNPDLPKTSMIFETGRCARRLRASTPPR